MRIKPRFLEGGPPFTTHIGTLSYNIEPKDVYFFDALIPKAFEKLVKLFAGKIERHKANQWP